MFTASDGTSKLSAALSKAQGEIKDAAKDGTNPHFHSDYATLAACVAVTRPALANNGLSLSDWPVADALVTVLTHSSGEWMRSVYPIKPERQTPQGYGSALTYGRRYVRMAIMGIAPVDDDGEAATNHGTKFASPRKFQAAKAAAPVATPPGPPMPEPKTQEQLAAIQKLSDHKGRLIKLCESLRGSVPEGGFPLASKAVVAAIVRAHLQKASIATLDECEQVRKAIAGGEYDPNTGAKTLRGPD